MDNIPEVPIAETLSKKRFFATILIVVIILGGLGFYLGRPLFASYYLEKGIAELQMGGADNLERADSYLQKSLRWNSGDPLAHYYLARVAFGRGTPMVGYTAWTEADWPRVIEHYEKALVLGLEKRDARLAEIALSDTGRAYRKLGDYKKADEIFREHISRYPEKSFVSRYLLASDDFEVNNDPDEALRVLLPALEATDKIDLRMFRVYTLLARLYHYADDPANTKKYATLAINSVPEEEKSHLDVQIAHIILAIERSKAKDLKTSLESYENAKKIAQARLNTASDTILNCTLARIHMLTGDYDKAIVLAKNKIAGKTSFGYTDSFFCIEALARSYLAKKDAKEAKQYLEQYINVSDTFTDKNIYVLRNRVEFQKILKGM